MRIPVVLILMIAAAGWLAAAPAVAEEPTENATKEAPVDPDVDETDAPEADDRGSLNLRADQIIYEADSFTCTENVVITYGAARIECDKVVGTITEVEKTDEETGEKTKENAITHLVATGSPLTMISQRREARCLKAVYDLIEGKVILTGSKEQLPELMQDGRTARSERITFLINEQKFVFEKSSEIEIPLDGATFPAMLE